MTGIFIGLILYLAATFGISIYTGRKEKNKSSAGFIVGEKNFGSVVTSLAMGTTLASGFAFIGLVGMGYTLGLVATWQCIWGTVLEFFCWFFLAHKLRAMSGRTEVLTPIEAMSKLHGDPRNLIKIFGGLMIGLFITFYLAGQFTAASKAADVMGLNPTSIAVGIAVLTIVYIFLGGVNAAMWTNAIQGFVMILSFGVLVAVALSKVGGLGGLFASLSHTDPSLIQWNNGRSTGDAAFYICNYWLGSAAGFLAQPQAIQKYLTIKSDRQIRKSCVLSIIFNIIRQLGPVLIGMSCRLIYPAIADPETCIPRLIVDYIPNIVGGILMAGIFAAVMSTTESLLLQSTSELSRNFLEKGILVKKEISQKTYGLICKLLTVVIGIIGLLISLYGSGGVFNMIIFAWTGLMTSVGPSLYLGLYWKRCTSQGILAGILTGIPATCIWYYLFKSATGIHEAVSIVVPILAVVLVSLLTQNGKQGENWAEKLRTQGGETENTG